MTAAINFSKRISEFPILTQLTGNEDIPYSLNGQNGRFKSGSLGGSLPGIYGPTQIYSYTTNLYLITADDLNSPATVTTNQGTINQTGNTFTLNPGSYTGPLIITMGSQTFTITVNSSIVNTPSIITPVSGTQNLGSSVTLTASAFTMTGFQDIHKATNWQIATDSAFTNIVQQSLMDQVNLTSWTVSNLTVATTYYVRVQYISGTGITSNYSATITFSTSATFTPSRIIARIASGAYNSIFGISVSLNSAGDVALVGASYENNHNGAAYIYTNQNGTWTQTARIATEIAGDYFGRSVSLNSTGNIALIGAFYENTGTGAAYIYTNQNGIWTQTARITSINGGWFGWSVSLNSTGDIALIGASHENNNIGAAYIYTNQNGTWTQTARIVSGMAYNYFGISVSLNGTGNIALIGSYIENAAYIYTNQGGTWTQTARISSGVANSYFGQSVSLSGDGATALIGAYNENNNTGAAYIYTNQSGTWTQTARISSGVSNSQFGYSVSLNSTGTVAIIGAQSENSGTGAAYIYTNQNGVWTQTARIFSGVASSGFGNSISLNSTGNIALIGAWTENSLTGAAYIVQ